MILQKISEEKLWAQIIKIALQNLSTQICKGGGNLLSQPSINKTLSIVAVNLKLETQVKVLKLDTINMFQKQKVKNPIRHSLLAKVDFID